MPGSTKSALRVKYRSAMPSSVAFSGGTTELMITPRISLRIEARQGKKIARQDAVLVHGLIARRGQPPVGDQLRAAKNAQHRVGIAHVNSQQHQFASETSPEITTEFFPSSRRTRSRPFGSRPSVMPA